MKGMRWTSRVRQWFRLILDRRIRYAAVRVEDPPDDPEKGVLYLVGDSEQPWSAAFLCPCGCQATISLSLIPHDSPRWKIRLHVDGSISLIPSIWRTTGCHSHFFINRGRVLWARATQR